MSQLLKAIKPLGLVAVLLFLCAVVGVVYYYWTTDPDTILIVTQDFPSGLNPGFGPPELTHDLLQTFHDIVSEAQAPAGSVRPKRPGQLGYQVVSIAVPPMTSMSGPLPIFDRNVKGINLALLREIGMSLKARRLLDVTVRGDAKGFRLAAALKHRTSNVLDFETDHSWKSPQGDQDCTRLEACLPDLAEQVLKALQPRILIAHYFKRDDQEGYRALADLYETAISPLSAADHLGWGDALVSLKEYEKALGKYDQALQQDQSLCQADISRGIAFLSRFGPKDLDRAEEAFRRAIKCDEKSAPAYNNLGNVLIRRWAAGGKRQPELAQEAKKHCEEALRRDPQLVAAAINTGYLLYNEGARQQAIDYFEQVKDTFPTTPAFFLNYGFLLYREYLLGKDALLWTALEHTTRAWTLDPKNWVTADNLAFLSYEAGHLAESVKYWQEAYRMNPKDPDVLAGLGLGLLKSGKQEDAVRFYRDALLIEPQFKDLEYLRRVHYWSPRATRDVEPLIRLAQEGT